MLNQPTSLDLNIGGPTGILDSSLLLESDLKKYSKIIVFSPHLDDAVLSAGSLIYTLTKMGMPVEVISAFTEGSPATSKSIQIILGKSGFTESKSYFEERRKEDAASLSHLDVINIQHLGFIDAAWRVDQNSEPIYPDGQLREVNPKDQELVDTLSNHLKNLVKDDNSVGIITALGRGKHVDHQITRDAVTKAFTNIMYFEDFPYSALYASEDEYVKNNSLTRKQWNGDYNKKKESILLYKTQIMSLFGRGKMILPYEGYYSKTF